jgi:hypothetical protein
MEESTVRMEVFKHRIVLLPLAVSLLGAWPLATAQEGKAPVAHVPKSNRVVVSREFGSGGSVSLQINSGDLRVIRNTHANELRIEIMIESPKVDAAQAQREWVKRMSIEGNAALIELNLPSDRIAGAATLYVPAETALKVAMHAGKLVVSGVKGNKNLSVGTGMLTLREGDPSVYKHVKAEVSLGEMSDGVFHGKQSGLLGRTLIADGQGNYQLLLHVGTGDLVLTGEDGSL